MKKELYTSYFKDKHVTVLGLGLLGRGIGDTEFLASSGAHVVVTDKKTNEELASSVEALKDYIDISFHLGDHVYADFENKDFILKAAGVPLDSEYIVHAVKNSIPVYMSAALVCKIVMEHLPNVVIIGITGTRGKSTTTHLVAHVLRETHLRVHVGGNVRGVANLPLLNEIEDGDYLVLELDSWQLQGFGDMKISPHIAVFTSFMDDHMNYYKNDREKYFNDKANIYRYQKEYDVLIASPQASNVIVSYDKDQAVVVVANSHVDTHLIGEHNQTATKLAYEVASQCGLDDETIREALASCKPVEGRLEDMGVVEGVRVFNDNNATTGDATIVALEAINETYNRKPILIVGGTDKGLPVDELEKAIATKTKSAIYVSGTGTSRINLLKEYEYSDLKDCIAKAFEVADDEDIILFSPAFASFSTYFNNEYERNDVFVDAIKKYTKNS